MRPTLFFGLPAEILDQIFLDAINVRSYARAARLRLVCRVLPPNLSLEARAWF